MFLERESAVCQRQVPEWRIYAVDGVGHTVWEDRGETSPCPIPHWLDLCAAPMNSVQCPVIGYQPETECGPRL